MTIYNSDDFGRVLRTGRKGLGLTQRHAAEICGVSPRLWSEAETGKRSNVSFETALRMLQTVGFDLRAESRATRNNAAVSDA